MASATAGLPKEIGLCLVQLLPQVFQWQKTVEQATGFSIMDPVEPLLLLAFVICLLSWLLSWIGLMEFRGYFTTLTIGIATSRIHLLGALKQQLDRFAVENEHFRTANKDLKHNVNELNAQNDKLQASNSHLEDSIKSLEEVKDAMEQYASDAKGDLNELLSSLHNSIAEQKRIQQNCFDIEEKTRKLTVAQERSMLMGLFMQFQDTDGEKGLSKEELETLVDMLPEGAGERIKDCVRNFREIDSDGDGVVSMSNFRDFLRRVGEQLHDEHGPSPCGGFAQPARMGKAQLP